MLLPSFGVNSFAENYFWGNDNVPSSWSDWFQSSLYVRLSVSMSLCLLGRSCQFLAIIRSSHNCAQHMQPQATGPNNPSVSIICPYTHSSIRPQAFCYFLFLLISSVGVQHRDAFIPSEVQSSLYVFLSLRLSGRPRRFFGNHSRGPLNLNEPKL